MSVAELQALRPSLTGVTFILRDLLRLFEAVGVTLNEADAKVVITMAMGKMTVAPPLAAVARTLPIPDAPSSTSEAPGSSSSSSGGKKAGGKLSKHI